MAQKFSDLRLMVIGAGWEQVPLITKAKELGCYVLATAPSKGAEGFEFADEHAIVDPRDVSKVMSLAKRFMPSGITADQCDYSHYAAAYVSTLLGLNNDGLNAAQYTTNKGWMREKC